MTHRPEDPRRPRAAKPTCRGRNAASVGPAASAAPRGGRRPLAALLASAALGVIRAAGVPPSERVAQADAWLRLRRELARERAAWTVRRERIEQRIDLLALERESLEARLAEAAGAATQQEQERRIREGRLQAWADGLREADERIGALARRLETAPDGATWSLPADWPTPERLRALLARAIELQHRHQRLWHEHRILSTPAGRLRMEVLHLGLAQAYAVAVDDQQAGHGVWTGAEWRWSWNTEWAPAIRQAIRTHRSEGPPRWSELPLALPGGPP